MGVQKYTCPEVMRSVNPVNIFSNRHKGIMRKYSGDEISCVLPHIITHGAENHQEHLKRRYDANSNPAL